MLAWIIVVALAGAPPTGALVVELNPPAASGASPPVQSVRGETVLSSEILMRRITGLREPRDAKPRGFIDMLAEADRLEARFETASANAMRVEILRSYDAAARITSELLVATARASQDRAASAFNERQRRAAEELALETARRFPEIAVDGQRHNPDVVALFERSRKENARAEKGVLRVFCTGEGVVHADGRVLGAVQGDGRFELPVGYYRVWVEGPNGSSLAREVEVRKGADVTVSIDAEVESRLQIDPVALRCAPTRCAPLLERLRALTATRVVVGLERAGDDTRAILVQADAEPEEIDPATLRLEDSAEPIASREFSALYLLPLGIGQAAQERYVAAGAYAAIQLGLGAWNVAAGLEASDARDNGDPDLQQLQDRQDLSAILFYSSLAASIIESVVVWSLSDE